MIDFPPTRGQVTPQKPLADLTWLRVGGPARVVFQPADVEDLQAVLTTLPPEVPIFPIGVGSNLKYHPGLSPDAQPCQVCEGLLWCHLSTCGGEINHAVASV